MLPQGLRPIHYAVWQRYSEAVQLLLVRGCDVNSTDDCGYSPLHLAAEHGYIEMMKVNNKHERRKSPHRTFPSFWVGGLIMSWPNPKNNSHSLSLQFSRNLSSSSSSDLDCCIKNLDIMRIIMIKILGGIRQNLSFSLEEEQSCILLIPFVILYINSNVALDFLRFESFLE
jgi:hypothetical protein